jgi:Flp pilus assembly protein TadG
MLVLVCLAMMILIVAAAFSTDLAYMFLAREQLHVSTDAACKAAVTQLALGSSAANQAAAIQKAKDYASYNPVCGDAVTLTDSNIVLGGVSYSSGYWVFNKDATLKTAAQVTAQKPVSLFFGKALGTSVFTPNRTSTAAFVRNKWCLVFDRSGSMCWDMSGVDSRYPTGAATIRVWDSSSHKLVTKTITTWSNDDPPHPTKSRWASIQSAADIFLATLGTSPVENQVGLVTFGNYGATDCTFSSTTYQPIDDALAGYVPYWTPQFTNLKDGLQHAVDLFSSTDDGTPWNKIIIVLSDGDYTSGGNPMDLISTITSQGIVVHTVGMFDGGNNNTMINLASQSGGRSLMANNTTDLQNAFNTLTQTIPVILTQ